MFFQRKGVFFSEEGVRALSSAGEKGRYRRRAPHVFGENVRAGLPAGTRKGDAVRARRGCRFRRTNDKLSDCGMRADIIVPVQEKSGRLLKIILLYI